MQTLPAPDETLPKGIWHEPERNRYRIRLYWQRRVIFRAYCHDKPSALAALALGKQKREAARNRKPPVFDVSSAAALVTSALAATR